MVHGAAVDHCRDGNGGVGILEIGGVLETVRDGAIHQLKKSLWLLL